MNHQVGHCLATMLSWVAAFLHETDTPASMNYSRSLVSTYHSHHPLLVCHPGEELVGREELSQIEDLYQMLFVREDSQLDT